MDSTAILTKFAPLVYLHPDDPIRPCSVNWLLPYAVLKAPDNSVVLRQGEVTSQSLISQVFKGKSSGYTSNDPDDLPSYHTTNFSLFFPHQTNPMDIYTPSSAPLTGEPLTYDRMCTAECYAHLRPMPDLDAIDLVYAFFYPYNAPTGLNSLFPGTGVHVGDWEHITVRISSDAQSIQQVYFSRHAYADGRWLRPDQCAFSDSTNTHVVVFSARYSHASFSSAGAHANPKIHWIAADYTAYGPAWPTWEHLVDVGDIVSGTQPTAGHEWLRYTGRWGNTEGIWVTEHGPHTPSFQRWWNLEAGESMYRIILAPGLVDAALAKGYTGIQIRQTCKRDSDYTHNNSSITPLTSGDTYYFLTCLRCKRKSHLVGKNGSPRAVNIIFHGPGLPDLSLGEIDLTGADGMMFDGTVFVADKSVIPALIDLASAPKPKPKSETPEPRQRGAYVDM